MMHGSTLQQEMSKPTVMAVDGAVRIELATARDRSVVRRIECECFGLARFVFGLWPRTGRGDTLTWIATTGDRVAGYLIAYQKELDDRPVMYVGGVGVSRHYRQHGIGKQLMKAVLAEHDSLWLHVRAQNVAAINLYHRLGMCQLRRLEQFYSNGDDAIVMATRNLVPDI